MPLTQLQKRLKTIKITAMAVIFAFLRKFPSQGSLFTVIAVTSVGPHEYRNWIFDRLENGEAVSLVKRVDNIARRKQRRATIVLSVKKISSPTPVRAGSVEFFEVNSSGWSWRDIYHRLLSKNK
jgi:hypothetical protein